MVERDDSATDVLMQPQHVAIIMDGNGRWAQARGLSRSDGHRQGLQATRDAVEFFARRGTQVLTLFAFSSENWQRPRDEVEALLDLFMTSIEAELPELIEQGIRLRFIGDRASFPQPLRERMHEAEQESRSGQAMILVVALGYGGHWDILQAVQRYCQAAQAEQHLTPEVFEGYLSTSGLPAVDFLIRTGGEQRISNFLLWQTAYAELCFLSEMWPDVDAVVLERALLNYRQRQRRFGGVH